MINPTAIPSISQIIQAFNSPQLVNLNAGTAVMEADAANTTTGSTDASTGVPSEAVSSVGSSSGGSIDTFA
jgi:hypothetical protein